MTTTVERIVRDVADRLEIDPASIAGKARHQRIAHGRALCYLLVRELTHLSYPAIAREFGSRDHTTVMSGCRRAELLLRDNPELQRVYDAVKSEHVVLGPLVATVGELERINKIVLCLRARAAQIADQLGIEWRSEAAE